MNPTENTTPHEASNAPPPSEETIRKVYVKDLREKQRIHTVFKATKKARHTARSGKVFLALTLGDKTGEVEGRIFEQVDAADAAFVENDYLLVEANIISFHGKPQVVIEKLQRLDPEPIDAAEFAVPVVEKPEPTPTPSSSSAIEPSKADAAPRESSGGGVQAVAQIRELVDRVGDTNVRALLNAFLDDPAIARGLPLAPAAKGIHHAYRGGLADHILSVMKLAHRIADHYPMADRDLVVAGALLHDIDKVTELSFDKGFEYSDEGRLVGHIVMTAQRIREKAAQIPGFPKALEHHITHLVLAHHGKLEYGSPKLPMTLEAFIVHTIDELDSRIASWLEVMEKDPNATWTETSKLYERRLYKGPSPTSRGKSPVEGRGAPRGEKRRRNRNRGGGSGGGAPSTSHAPAKKAEGDSLPVSFKPLNALTGGGSGTPS